MNNDNILKLSDNYEQMCINNLLKLSFIRKLPNGKYRVLSEKGRNLGTYTSKEEAKKRLRQIEFFKHKDKNKSSDSGKIDLTDLDELSYSAILRTLRKKAPKECIFHFMKIYKEEFDNALRKKIQKPEKVAIQNSLILFNKQHNIKLNSDLIKNAAISELGNPVSVGKYISDIIKFIMMRVDLNKRRKFLDSLKNKIYYLDERDISNKNLPSSSAMGQSITLVKHILFNHDPVYVRNVINNIVRNL